MTPIDATFWAEYGLQGLVIASLASFIVFMFKEHRQERQEMRTDARHDNEKVVAALDKLSDVIRDTNKT